MLEILLSDLDDIWHKNGPLAALIEGYVPRLGQSDMAAAVARNLFAENAGNDTGNCLVIEAETGVGKTLGYLLPAVLSGKRVIISTATLHLQDQILNKELPVIEKVLGTKLSVVCLKGRENYLCLYRWFQRRSASLSKLWDGSGYEDKVSEWLKTTHDGDLGELEFLGSRSGFWGSITASTSQCLGGDCPEGSECFVNLIRKRAGAAQVVVVNHHLFFSDLALRLTGHGELLPRYEAVIFDEAHHIENVATAFFGKSFSQYQLLDLFGDIDRELDAAKVPEDVKADVVRSISGLNMRLTTFAGIFPPERGRFYLTRLISDLGGRWTEEIELLFAGMGRLANACNRCTPYGGSWENFMGRVQQHIETLRHIVDTNEAQEEGATEAKVLWFERREKTVVLFATPVEIVEEMNTGLFSQVRSCVFTSATLSSGHSFSYLRERIGLPETTDYMQIASPFDYENRTLLYVPEIDFPDPGSPQFLARSSSRIHDILKLSRGRALLLFTSFKAMEFCAQALEGQVDYPILVQGRASRNSLLREFRSCTESVLLAVASFWEGVDVVGESLSCLVIDKLPFEVPSDPVIQSRIELIKEKGGKPFFEFQVPRAILTLRQGYGRLMRSVHDQGVIAIMDTRLFSKGYGRVFRKSLPPSPVSRSLVDVESFFQRMATQQHNDRITEDYEG